MIELLLQAERALSVGLLDRAETLYRQVAAADPRNSIAVVGLARVAIERGDELEALELGRRALEIDPENSAAQRLVQRLEEVRAYRGEAPGAGVRAARAGARARPARPRQEPEAASAPKPEPPNVPRSEAPAPARLVVRSRVDAPPRARSWLDRLLRRNR